MRRSRRLCLLAMSGVRVENDALRKLGLTLPGFVERSRVIASLPSLSLLTLASHTPDSWEISYRELDLFDDKRLAALAAERFDLVAISSFTARILDAYRVADFLRAAGIAVALGGLHVSALPEEAGAHADVVVEGEGERTWPLVLADIEAGTLRPRYRASDTTPFSLDHSRVPRFDLLDLSRYNRVTLQTTRGCPHHCHFCAASRTISRYQKKPIALIAREIEAILARWDRPFLELADDNTFVDKKWSKELLRLFRQYPLRWFTETDVSLADDEECLDLLAGSGCAQVLIGFEAAHREGLRGIDGKDWKLRQYESYLPRIERLQSRGISVNGCFILGHDADDDGVFERTRDFVRASGLAEVQITLLTPFPGTALHRRLAEERRLLADVYWNRCTLFDATFVPQQMSVAALEDGFRWLMSELYSDDERKRRKQIFRQTQRRARREKESPDAESAP